MDCTSGGLQDYYIALYPDLGYYHYDGSKWVYPEYFKNSTFKWNILSVKPNPANINEVFLQITLQEVESKVFIK